MTETARRAQDTPADDVFGRYAPPASFHDEMFDREGRVRPHWQPFHEAIVGLGQPLFARQWESAKRLVEENGIAYGAYGDPADTTRPWQLDPLPVLITSSEWAVVSTGLQQRAQLLDLILSDLWGEQSLLTRGLLPSEVVFAHPGFLRPFHGQASGDEGCLHFYAADLGRSSDGRWWVLADRTEAPSGAGFALENRIVISRMLPNTFRRCEVERLAPYFSAVQETLGRLARRHADNPHVALLCHGPKSPNYFKDAYLARYLGYTLVEGSDLAVRGGAVRLKTLGGLLPVDVILRRPNSADCDPLELSAAPTAVGVTRLLQAARERQVAIANAFGSGLVESPVFMAFLPGLCQALLGEELKIPGVATWWCGEPKSLGYVLDHLDELVVKRAYRVRGREFRVSKDLDKLSTTQLRETINAHPALFVAQERVTRSSTPVWRDKAVHSSHIALRAYLVGGGQSYTVMQGALARVSKSSDPLEMSILAGEGSKDTWILSDGPVGHQSLLQEPGQVIELRRTGSELPSRVAEHLFWLGRHVERADGAARLLRAIALRLTSEADPGSLVELRGLIRVLVEQGQVEAAHADGDRADDTPPLEDALPAAVFDEECPASLRSVLNRLFRMVSMVRDRISVDTWRVAYRIDERFRPPRYGRAQLFDVLSRVNELVIELAAFNGMVSESMTRTQGWIFLDVGHRLERAVQMLGLLRYTLADPSNVQSPSLAALLEIAESSMTYRSRYKANLQYAAVLDLLLTDETNPRSVAYQLAVLVDHVEHLPRDDSRPQYTPEQRLALSALHTIRMTDVQSLIESGRPKLTSLDRLAAGLDSQLAKLSNAISNRYLIHAGPAYQLSEMRPESSGRGAT